MPTPTPTPPRHHLRLVTDLPVSDVVVAACRRRAGWTVAAVGEHESVVLEQVPRAHAGLLLALAFEQVKPLADARIRTLAPAWADHDVVARLQPAFVDDADRRLDVLDIVIPITDRPAPPRPVAVAPLDVACDASLGRAQRRRIGGIAAVTAEGEWIARPIRTPGTIGSLELRAIHLAIDELGTHRPLHITSDSLWAVAVANGVSQPHTAADIRAARAVRAAMRSRGHSVSWVRGHAGDRLNECADRLAVTIRRAAGFNIHHSSTTLTTLQRIAADACSADAIA